MATVYTSEHDTYAVTMSREEFNVLQVITEFCWDNWDEGQPIDFKSLENLWEGVRPNFPGEVR